MKKSLFSMGFKSVLATCVVLIAMLFSSQDLSAQSGTLTGSANGGQTVIKTTGTWVSSTDAVVLLSNEADQLDNTLITLGQSNSTTDYMKIKSEFYRGIVVSILDGKDVPTAIMTNYDKVGAVEQPDSPTTAITNPKMETLLSEVIDLLNN
jgi:uncharacterized protein YabE (DUF348 family)